MSTYNQNDATFVQRPIVVDMAAMKAAYNSPKAKQVRAEVAQRKQQELNAVGKSLRHPKAVSSSTQTRLRNKDANEQQKKQSTTPEQQVRQDYPTPAPVKSFLDSGPLMFMPGVGTAAIAGETGLDIAENGLNWANGLQAGLSLLPIAGPVAKSLSTATKDFAKGFNEYRLSRAMNDAVTDFKGSPSVVPERRIQLADQAKQEVNSFDYWNSGKEFKSELDWSPESWFGTRAGNYGYNADDIMALQAHMPEYLKIEQQAKSNGTWLQMPDGSTWKGDPRSWVQLMSKDGSKLQQRVLYHGDNDVTPEVLGSKTLWTSTNKYMPVTYGKYSYQVTLPKGIPNVTFDADGRFWNNLSAPSSYKYRNTNDVRNDLLKNDGTLNINNVVDVGGTRWIPGQQGLPAELPQEKLLDYFDRVFKGDDVILGKNVPRKSLLGNNGNFDLSNKNIYKAVIPLVLGGKSISEYNKKEK